jgi:hypothetical protein
MLCAKHTCEGKRFERTATNTNVLQKRLKWLPLNKDLGKIRTHPCALTPVRQAHLNFVTENRNIFYNAGHIPVPIHYWGIAAQGRK